MKYDDLVAEVEQAARIVDAAGYSRHDVSRILTRLAAAIRDLQQHAPPEGWRVTAYTNEGRGVCVQWFLSEGYWAFWPTENRGWSNGHPTAAAAMAAIEETK